MATRFNINERHVLYIKALVSQYDVVIIHGDGTIFHSNNDDIVKYRNENGSLEDITAAEKGSRHHKTFNAGFDDFEAISIAKYRAVYTKKSELPTVPKDITDAFFRQAEESLRGDLENHIGKNTSVFSIEEDQPKKEKKTEPEPETVKEVEPDQNEPVTISDEKPKSKGGRPKNK